MLSLFYTAGSIRKIRPRVHRENDYGFYVGCLKTQERGGRANTSILLLRKKGHKMSLSCGLFSAGHGYLWPAVKCVWLVDDEGKRNRGLRRFPNLGQTTAL